jgi:hypothetical protein
VADLIPDAEVKGSAGATAGAGIAAADYLAMRDLHTALNLIAADRNHQ